MAHIALPYNAILGYPALAKFMAITHHAYNLVKLPGYSGTLTICCDEKEALCSIEHTYKDAEVAFPAVEDDIEPECIPSKKKQLFSQERIATKKVPLDASGSGATLTIGGPPYQIGKRARHHP